MATLEEQLETMLEAAEQQDDTHNAFLAELEGMEAGDFPKTPPITRADIEDAKQKEEREQEAIAAFAAFCLATIEKHKFEGRGAPDLETIWEGLQIGELKADSEELTAAFTTHIVAMLQAIDEHARCDVRYQLWHNHWDDWDWREYRHSVYQFNRYATHFAGHTDFWHTCYEYYYERYWQELTPLKRTISLRYQFADLADEDTQEWAIPWAAVDTSMFDSDLNWQCSDGAIPEPEQLEEATFDNEEDWFDLEQDMEQHWHRLLDVWDLEDELCKPISWKQVGF